MVVVIYNSGIDFLPGCRFVVRVDLDGTIIVEAGRPGSIDIASHLLTAISPGTGFLSDSTLHYALKAQEGILIQKFTSE